MKVQGASFIRFVYPFLFNADSFTERVERIDGRSREENGKSDQANDSNEAEILWQKERFPEGELLPHVARYLNPPEGSEPTVRLWQIAPEVLQSPRGLGAGARNRATSWYLIRGTLKTRFFIEDIQFTLYSTGVGFLTVRIRPDVVDVSDWLDFQHFFRFLHGRGVSLYAQRRVGFDKEAKKAIMEDYFPLIAGGPPKDPKIPRELGDIIDGLLGQAAATDEAEPWWSDVFIADQLLPYAVLFVTDTTQDEQQRYKLLYKMHNFFRSQQGETPAREELCPSQPHLLPYADQQWFVFSLDGGSFVAFDPPDTEFFRTTLPDHLDTQYLLLFLLASQQRFALMGFSDQVTRSWEPTGHSREAAEVRASVFSRIRDALLSFTARGYFAQVMQRRHHHRCYRLWQETFQVEQLFREVSDEVRDMHDYLLMEKTERIEKLARDERERARRRERLAREEREQGRRTETQLNILAAFLLVPALILAFLDAVGNNSWSTACFGVLLGLGMGGILMLCLQAHRFRKGSSRLGVGRRDVADGGNEESTNGKEGDSGKSV